MGCCGAGRDATLGSLIKRRPCGVRTYVHARVLDQITSCILRRIQVTVPYTLLAPYILFAILLPLLGFCLDRKNEERTPASQHLRYPNLDRILT